MSDMKGFIKRDKLLITEDFERAVLGKELADFAKALQPSLLWYQSFYDACSQEFASHLPEQSKIPPRLGLYFEWLWLQALQCHPDYQLLGSNIQIQHEGRTLGSLDFLVLDTKTDTVEHWELACKFYLCYRDGQEVHWLGPNLNDHWA